MAGMRAVLLATALSLAAVPEGLAASPAAAGEPASTMVAAAVENSAIVRATAPPAGVSRAYGQPLDALLEADLDSLVTSARDAFGRGERTPVWGTLVFLDDLAADRFGGARATLQAMPDGVNGAAGDLYEPFLLLAEGRADAALERLGQGAADLPDPLPQVARALILEGAGRLEDAAIVYAGIVAGLDVTPPGDGEPQTEEDLTRALAATRTVQILYRAALANHRLGRAEEAARLYALVEPFAPHSADVIANRARLAEGAPPLEPALDARRATGRWLMFLSDYLTNTEGLMALLSNPEGVDGLASPSAALFLQFGVLLDPAADDWTLAAANQLVAAKGYGGAQRILARLTAQSVFAAEAELSRASIFLQQKQDDRAVAAAQAAERVGAARWAVLSGAGDVYRAAGRDRAAVAAQSRALALAQTPKDRADVLSYRAYAHFYAGRLDAAVRDVRDALALAPDDDDIRYMAITVLMDHPTLWREGVAIARAMFAERPDSGVRLNSLGYALIQRPEGLEEGYRLLWRGFTFRSFDYAVIDSLGWAYYQYGRFAEARALIERANQLSQDDPNSEVLDHLGDVYWRLGMRDEARQAWRDALEARPDARRRERVSQKLRRGLTTPAPVLRDLPQVDLPQGPAQREET
jgi:tetratricopeptide (TPR) repeat protein